MSAKRVLLFAALLPVAMPATDGHSQSSNWSIASYVGGGYLPMKDSKDFLSSPGSQYEPDQLGLYLEFTGAYHVGDRHAVVLGVEYVKTAAAWSGAIVARDSQGRTTGLQASVAMTYGYTTIPIDLSYEFHLRGTSEAADPFVGAGMGYYISSLDADVAVLADNSGLLEGSGGTRNGSGYGVHMYVGMAARLSETLDLVTRLRGRYADGMYFSDRPESIDVDFHGLDLTVGVRWAM
jgi:outer membrane protein W